MDFPRFVSTAEVPPDYLKSAMLVGAIPFKALKSDPRVSYTLHIPREHYNPGPSRQYPPDSKDEDFELNPMYGLPLLPLLVNVHGTGRNAEQCRDCLKDFAHSERVAILSPLFPAGIDSYTDLDNYKLLSYKTLRADLAFLEMLDEVALRWPGIATEKVIMMGFSGGGQFVQRFMYLHSQRLLLVSIGAAGRVTALDKGKRWPEGIQDVDEIFGPGTLVDKEVIARLPIQLVVGGADNEVHGGDGFWKWLQEKKDDLADEQGILKKPGERNVAAPRTGRLDTLKVLQMAWEEEGITSWLDVIEGVKHDSRGVLGKVQEFLKPILRALAR